MAFILSDAVPDLGTLVFVATIPEACGEGSETGSFFSILVKKFSSFWTGLSGMGGSFISSGLIMAAKVGVLSSNLGVGFGLSSSVFLCCFWLLSR